MRNFHNDPHVICLSETFIKKGEESYLKLHNYVMATSFCRDKHRGGTCVLIKKGMGFKELSLKAYVSVNTFEACGIELTEEKLVIICLYRTPQSDPNQFLVKLDSILQYLATKYNSKTRMVLAGDFNINTFKKGKITQDLQDLAHTHNLKIHIDVATRKCSCIDHILSNMPDAIAQVLPLHLSDHDTAQILSFPLRVQTKAATFHIYKRDYSLNNIHKFRECLQNLSWSDVYVESDANTAFNHFHELICLFHNLCFPKVRIRINTNNNIKRKWMTKGLKVCSKTKRFLRYQYYKNKNRTNKIKYTTYSNLLQKCIHNAKRNANIKFINDNKNKCKATWSVIKNETQSINSGDHIENIQTHNAILTKPAEIASAFNNYYINGFPVQNSINNHRNENTIANSMFLTPMSENEIGQHILSLNNTNSEGYDELNTKIIKECAHELTKVLTYLINLSFSRGVFPSALKLSVVKPLFKKGERDDMNNYRPITLIPILSKIYEKCMYHRLMSYCEKFNIIKKEQFGFQKRKSTTLAIFSLLKTILNGINNNQLVTGLFFDLSKAFDLVSHVSLLQKLEALGIRGLPHQWISSYLTDRQQCVTVTNVNRNGDRLQITSDYQCIKRGVPQGSILGPILFLLYINDIIDVTKHKCFLYADDISIIVTTDKKFQTITDHKIDINNTIADLINWLNNNNLSINFDKSIYIQFNKCYNDKFNFKMDIPKINQVTQTKFLGVVIDEYLDWKAQVEHVCSKVNKFVYALRKIKKITNIKTAIMSYRAYVESSLRYGIIKWGNSTDFNRAFVAQKKCIRAIYGIPSDESCKPIFKKLGLLPLPSIYIYEVCMFVHKHKELFKRAEDVCSRSRRDQFRLVLDVMTRCAKYNKNCVAMCVRIFNKLPNTFKVLNCRLFKTKLYNWLTENCFYSVKEFLEHKL